MEAANLISDIRFYNQKLRELLEGQHPNVSNQNKLTPQEISSLLFTLENLIDHLNLTADPQIFEECKRVVTDLGAMFHELGLPQHDPQEINPPEEAEQQEGTDSLDGVEFPDGPMKVSSGDRNDDYCTVCRDGGGRLVCCDVCTKVFHFKCHIPSFTTIPQKKETGFDAKPIWQCMFCTSKNAASSYKILYRVKVDPKNTGLWNAVIVDNSGPLTKIKREENFLKACKLLAEIYSLKESVWVRFFVDELEKNQVNFKRDLRDLHGVRKRLDGLCRAEEVFTTEEEFLQSVRTMLEWYISTLSCATNLELNWAKKFKTAVEGLMNDFYP